MLHVAAVRFSSGGVDYVVHFRFAGDVISIVAQETQVGRKLKVPK